MFIIRWILSHPIIAIWSLFALVMILNFNTGKSDSSLSHDDTVAETSHKAEQNIVSGKVQDKKEDLATSEKDANHAQENIKVSTTPASLLETSADVVATQAAALSLNTEKPTAPEKPEAPVAPEQPVLENTATTGAVTKAEEIKEEIARNKTTETTAKADEAVNISGTEESKAGEAKADEAVNISGTEEGKAAEVPVAPEKPEAPAAPEQSAPAAEAKADETVNISGTEEGKAVEGTAEVPVAPEKPEAPAAPEQSAPAAEATAKTDGAVNISGTEESKAGEAKAEVPVAPEKPEVPTAPEAKADEAVNISGTEEGKAVEGTAEVPEKPETPTAPEQSAPAAEVTAKVADPEQEVAATDQAAEESKAELSTSEAVSAAVTQLKNTQQQIGETAAPITATGDNTGNLVDTKTEQLASGGQVASVSDSLLNQARVAYWNNNLEQSVSLYKELIAKDSNKINYKGELANVLWRMKQPKESAKIYSEIALPMIEAGRSVEVSNMLGFIGAYFPEKAREIHMQMTQD